MNKKANEHITTQLREFTRLIKGEYPIHTFNIDCARMPKPIPTEFTFDKRKTGMFRRLFNTLEPITTPCLYWFECNNEVQAANAEIEILNFKEQKNQHGRTTPAKNSNINSKILYVGIRQGGTRKADNFSHIAGRIFTHLGYYEKGSTQGLQLAYWCKSKLKLTVMELPSEAKPYLNIIEKFYALSFRPLLGKH